MTPRADTSTLRLAGARLPAEDAAGPHAWRVDLRLDAFPALADHRVEGTVVVPASAYVAMALDAARRAGDSPGRMDDLIFPHAFYLPEHGARTLHLTLTPGPDGASFHAYSHPDGAAAGAAVTHARLRMANAPVGRRPSGPAPARLRNRCPDATSGADWYAALARRGNQYGPAFRCVRRLWRGRGEAVGAVRVSGLHLPDGAGGTPLVPLLDAAAQVLAAARDGEARPFVLERCDSLRLYGQPEQAGQAAWIYAHAHEPGGGDAFAGDVQVLDEGGRRLLDLHGVRLRTLPAPRRDGDEAPATLAVAASFTAEPLEEVLAFWMDAWDAPARILFAPAGPLFPQLLDPGSLLARNRDGVNVVLLRFEDWVAPDAPPALDRPGRDRLLADKRRYTLPNGLEVAHLHAYETDYLYREIFVEQAYLRHGVTLGPGSCVVDVGANIGLFTLFALARCRPARVYAFEPSPEAFEALRANAALYGGEARVFDVGLAASEGEAPFTRYPRASVFSGFHADPDEDRATLRAVIRNVARNVARQAGAADGAPLDALVAGRLEGETITCRTRTLSRIIAEERIDRIDLLKIDAEKSELDVLGGVEPADWDRIRQVVVEVHDRAGTRLAAVVALLEARGFACATEEAALLRGSGLHTVYAVRPTARRTRRPRRPPPALHADLERNVDDLVEALHVLQARTPVPLLLGLCPSPPGAGAARQALFERLERRLAAALRAVPSASLLDTRALDAAYPVDHRHDPYGDALARVPYTAPYFTALGTQLARQVLALRRPPYKVVVLDCDQTLWHGTCGEDGPLGVVVDAPRRQLQAFVAAQHAAGMLVCLCSRNDEDDVWAVFDAHPEMPLRREHLAAWRIGWEPKPAGLRSLARELRLGLDSFIFVDDDPVACAEVRAHCPEVLTLQLPPEPVDLATHLAHVWAFDRPPGTGEDEQRTRRYRQQRRREHYRQAAPTFASFLAGLGLHVYFAEAAPEHLARLAQLSQRTNQFNTSARRRSEAELRALLQHGALEGFVVDVRDRFGDYGLVGAALFETRADALLVDTLLLSCRALGRGVEHRMLARLGEIARERGLGRVEIAFHPTGKNRAALDFLRQTGIADGESDGDGGADLCFRIPAAAASAVVLDPDRAAPPPDDRAVRDASAARLPSPLAHRVATEWRDVDAIAAQIRDRKRRPQAEPAPAPPAGGLEGALAGLWEEVLDIRPIGLHDDFFALGGTSLQAVQILAQVFDLLQVEVSLPHLMASPTVAGLAQRVVEALGAAPGEAPPPLAPCAPPEPPLSFAQQRLWFIDRLHGGSPFYNVPLAFRLTGALDEAALADGLGAVAARHQALRTTIGQRDGRPVQVVAPAGPVALPVLDLSALPPAEREAEAQRLAREEAQGPFDLERGPLLRAGLLRLGEREHVLLLTSHHLVADAWSVHLLLRELAACYRGARTGEAVALPPLPVQYADYAVWHRAWLRGEALEARLAHAQRHLAGVAPLALPADRPRPAVQTYHGAARPFAIAPGLAAALRSLCRREGVTLYMLLLAAFEVLLHRYTGRDDLVVGTPAAGRSRVEVEHLIGYFADTLVLRTDLSGTPTFRTLLGRVRQAALQAYARRDVPFEKLVEALGLERDTSRSPLVQVIFDMQPAEMMRPPDLPGLAVETLPVDSGMVRFDLECHLWETDGGLRGTLAYNTDLFDAGTVARMAGHFETLLQGVAADPEQPVWALPLLPDAERAVLLEAWSGADTPAPPAAAIPALFEARVDRAPGTVALDFEGQSLTYAELDRRADALARTLRTLGVGLDVPVGLCVERSVEMVVGMLGILKAGGAYVPLDPAFPLERLSLVLEETGAPVVLTQERLLDRLPAHWGHVLCLDAEGARPVRHPDARLALDIPPEALAYVAYTSGSTGRPRGVAVAHRGVARLVRGADYARLGPGEVLLQLAPLAFDASTFEVWGTLLSGGRLVLMPPGPLTTTAIASAIERHGVTTLWLTSALFQAMVDTHPAALARVRQVLTGGDVLSVPHVQAHLRRMGPGRLVNGYGPTENTTFTTCFVMTGAFSPGPSVPIGRPVAGTQVYVLDAHGQPAPAGVVGELYAGGDGLARGYLNQPGATAERFVPNPFSRDTGARLYRTGDLARFAPDGTLAFVGRRDRQVKLRGFRIEPEEVEAALRRHPGVRDCVVLASSDGGDRHLVAYVATVPGGSADAGALRAFLRDRLPAYMVPSTFIPLAELPTTPGGKLDRRALPTPARPRAGDTREAPRTPVETAVAAVWREVLEVDDVGLDDDFFGLGGHSLLMPEVIVRLSELFQVELTLLNLLESPTVAGLARCIEGVRRNEQAP